MIKTKIDMTGWRMWEHGVLDSRLTVIKQVEDYTSPKGKRHAQWLVECSCDTHKQFIATHSSIKNGYILSCGCVHKERASAIMKKRDKKFNTYKIVDNIVYIVLSNCDEITKVNLDKWNNIEHIRTFCWHKDGRGYVKARIPNELQEKFGKKYIGLHQLVCPCDNGYEPDHIDRNKLNNLTDNLIPKTRQGNTLNRSLQSNNTSGVVGVTLFKRTQRWTAQITVNGTKIHLGCFINKKDAICARLQAEIQYFNDLAPQRHLFEQYGIVQQISKENNNEDSIK